MPQYKDGTLAKAGDRVVVEFDVVSVGEGDDADYVLLNVVDEIVDADTGTVDPSSTLVAVAMNARFCRPVPSNIVWGD